MSLLALSYDHVQCVDNNQNIPCGKACAHGAASRYNYAHLSDFKNNFKNDLIKGRQDENIGALVYLRGQAAAKADALIAHEDIDVRADFIALVKDPVM